MEIAFLVFAAVSATAAVLAWRQTVHARHNAARSADAAERSAESADAANHRAATPDVSIWSDGCLGRGVEVWLKSDQDLDRLQVELLRPPTGAENHNHVSFRGMYLDAFHNHGMHAHPVEGRGMQAIELRNVRAGQVYKVGLDPIGGGRYARAQFRLLAARGSYEWPLAEGFESVEVKPSS